MRTVWHYFVVTGQESSLDRVSVHCSSLLPSPPSFLPHRKLSTHSGPTTVPDAGNLFRQRRSSAQGQLESANSLSSDYSGFWSQKRKALYFLSLPLTRLTSSATWGSFPDFFFFFFWLHPEASGILVPQFSSVQSSLILGHPMDCSTPGLPVHHQLPEFNQTHVHWVGDAIQPSHPLLSPSSPTFNLSQHQGIFQWWVTPMSHSFQSGGHSIGASAPASILPMNIQDWFLLGWTGWISMQSKGLSRVFSNTTVQKHQFFGAQLF